MLKRFACLALALLILAHVAALAQSGTIEAVEVQGLYRMTREAFLHAFGVRPGDPYDVATIRSRFKALWALGLFEDISVEAETTPSGGKLLVVKVSERPVLSAVTYEDNSVATRTQIEDRLKERKLSFKLGKPIDMGLVADVETVIRDLLGEKGYLDAGVDAEVRKITETSRSVHFYITTGGKTRIKKIEFVGNEVFTDRKLRGTLKITEEQRWYWPWSQKNLYHPVKWEQDVTNVRDLYQNHGYLDVELRPPVVEVRRSKKAQQAYESRQREGQGAAGAEPTAAAQETAAGQAEPPPGLTPKQLENWAKKQRKQEDKARKKERKAEKKAQKKQKGQALLTVFVNEGPQYSLGEVTIHGNEKFPERLLRAAVPIAEGQVLRNNLLEAGVDSIRRLYENQGHLYATVVRRINRREGEDVADVDVQIEEDKPYYVARIEFSGNTSTRDRVLRREMLVNEGELFSRDKLDISKIKVNQLGYFSVPGEPVIEPVEQESHVNVVMPGEEQGRNEIQVGGGYSGVDGAFFNGVYSTRNFLGRGQVMSVAMQIGGRSSRYQLSFQEPWFLNRPILLGASIFRRDVDYGSTLKSQSSGFGVILGRRLGRWGQMNLGYNWEEVSSTNFVPNVAGSLTTTNRISSITPVYSYSSINNPYRPTRGRSLTLSMQIAGGPLGGDTAYIKPVIRFTQYRRLWGSRYMGLHAETGLVREWAGGSELNSSNINGIPRYQRFWLGGDTLGPRVFETRSITPLRYLLRGEGEFIGIADPTGYPAADLVTDSNGQPILYEVGGDRFFLLQTEFVWPLNEQAELAFFVDAGDAFFEDQSFNFDTFRVSAGIELRFHLPIFPVPLRLIYGMPVRDLARDRSSNFTFSIGRSF